MTLPDFLELISNLNPKTEFYLRFDHEDLPLAKITITASDCLFIPGIKAMTKPKVAKLVKNMHNRRIPIWMINGQEKFPTYGLQISIEKTRATLM